jgi:hypothetical protein
VRIISLSLGSATASDGNDPISAAVDAAVAAGKVAVVAAGNSGDTPGTVGSPGAARGALTVGAVAGWSGGPGLHLAPFSSRGPTTDGRTKPDVAAPGVAITSAQAGQRTGYVSFSGTSMATPFTSGTVALMLQRDPALTPSLVASRIAATARDRGVAGHDNDWGHGVLDGLAALAAADSTPASAAFPTSETVVGTVATGSVSRHEVSVTDTSMPLSATMLVDGELTCALFAFFCWAYEWSPDLELRLIAPNGTQLAASECPAYGNCAGVGHQETITVSPTVTGTYVLEVYPFDGSPNNGTGGPFVLDVSHGPLLQGLAPGDPVGGDDPGTDPPPEPPADDPVTHLTSGERAVLGDVDGSHVATHAPDGAVQTITEAQGGKGRNRYSGMEHRWIFEVADPGAWTLQMQAQTAGFSGGDGVTLAYSLNGKKWTKLGALGTEPYPLDGFTSGTLQVRVTDVDRTSGVQSNGTLAVDYLAITETTAQP